MTKTVLENMPSDLLGREIDEGYNIVTGTIQNKNAGAVGPFDRLGVFGQPVKLVSGQWRFVEAGDEANTGGICLLEEAVPELAADAVTVKTRILLRGPMVIRKTHLPATDIAEASLNATTIVTALEGLNPPIVDVSRSNPTSTGVV